MHFCKQILYIIVIVLSFTVQNGSAVVDEECIEKASSIFHREVKGCINKGDLCFALMAKYLEDAEKKCGVTVVYTLCRLGKVGILGGQCTSTKQAVQLTKEECIEKGSKEFMWRSADGKHDYLFTPQFSRCVPEYEFDCHSLC